MLAMWVKVRVKPQERERFLKAIEVDALGSERDEAGCMRFNVLQDAQDQNVYFFYEVYRDDAALEAHRAAPHYAVWGNLPADWFVGQKAVVIRGTMIAPSEA